MGADSKIEWTHHTFNPWWGCEKIDPECKNCYAAAFSKRTGYDVWGKTNERRFFGDEHWKEPLRWNARAQGHGERRRVFCASMADVFEDRADLATHRARLFSLIERCTSLDWMLLTKRPENMIKLAPGSWRDRWPSNVWAGTTGGCQETIDDNVPSLLDVPASIHFLSAEPLLEEVFIAGYLESPSGAEMVEFGNSWRPHLDLVITGAESGGKARPMHEDWVRSLRDQCTEAGVAFFYKQRLDGRSVVSLPMLDGRRWDEMPTVRP